MKIKTKTLTEFLSKTKMSGTQQIDECMLDFQKEGLKINANSPAKMSRVMAWLKTSAFEEYNILGKVGINDMDTIIKVMERFGEKITLKKEGNLLTIKGDNKKVDIELVSEDFLSTDSEPKLEFDDKFIITSKKMDEIIKDVKMNKDTIIKIKTTEKKVLFSNTGKYKFNNTIESEETKGGVETSYGEPLIDCVTNLTGTLEFSVKTNYPAKVMEKTDISVVTIIVAPRVEGSDEE